ncbi:hypothetical protein US8_00050 [Bacillus altitudinis]|uniref:hypothetical protein n=1 Tax=Bacillus altitudinis TaxID=293387 RepID=UPI000D9CCEDC|nr:hypothetical protein [Bacillus altitudinis]PYH27428.1 hypothetical protein US8_00050 [Bacillus altitudinis]
MLNILLVLYAIGCYTHGVTMIHGTDHIKALMSYAAGKILRALVEDIQVHYMVLMPSSFGFTSLFHQ